MDTEKKKVLVLHYAEPDGTETLMRGVFKRIYPDIEQMQLYGYILGTPKSKEFLKGKIRMYYSEVSDVPNLKVNGVIYNGPIVFVAFDECGQPMNISNNQMRAIKLVCKKL